MATKTDPELLAYEIAGTVGKDFDIAFIRRLENSAIQYRATIYKQEFDKRGRFPSGSEDSFTLEIIDVPPAECLNDEIECIVKRTKYKVPAAIRKGTSPIPFSFVGNMNQENSFTHIKPEEFKLILKGTRFIKNVPFYAYLNDYVYTFNHDGGKVTIRDVIADPRELLTLIDCNDKPCKANVNIDEDMKRTIKMMIFEELRQFNNLPEDKQIRINEQ